MRKLPLVFMLLLMLSALASPVFSRTVIDHSGYEVELPEKIERIIISGIWPLPSVYCLFEGDASKLVGMHPASMVAAENSVLPYIMPDILDVSTDFATGDGVNIEEVLALDPDVVFYNAGDVAEGEMYRAAGIPAVAFSTSNWNFDAIDTFSGWVELLGEVLQQDDKVDGIVEYGKGVEAFIQERLSSLGNLYRPRCLIIYRYDNNTINTSGRTHFGQYWITTAGGVNVAEGLSGAPLINMEQIYEWDPEKIFITNFATTLPEDLYDNVIAGHDWAPVSAVENKEVYKFPLGMYRWYPPASDTPLSLLWLATKIQSELFSDVDMDQTIRDYYQRFYNFEVTDEILYQIYNPSRDAAY